MPMKAVTSGVATHLGHRKSLGHYTPYAEYFPTPFLLLTHPS
jgi:hypothetical protein